MSVLLWLSVALAAQAADFRIANKDPAGAGFNDPTPAVPIGGNDGKTLGAQRLNALKFAARVIGSRIGSTVPIRVAARFANSNGNSLACSRNRSTLGNGIPAQFTGNFEGAPRADTFYPVALANALAGRRIADTDDIDLHFNPKLDAGNKDCLQGARWYYGLNDKVPKDEISFVATAMHELIHGIGFVSYVYFQDTSNSKAGQFAATTTGERWPDIYSTFIRDLSMPGQPLWTELTADQRAASFTDGPDVVWSNAVTANAAAGLLTAGLTQGYVRLYAPSTLDPGSSISHWDTSLSPNEIMEPYENPDMKVLSGIGLSACVLENMGWQLINNTRCPDVGSAAIAGSRPAEAGHDNGGQGGSGGGGGCTVDPDAPLDPIWCLLLGLASATLLWRRRALRH